VQNLKGFAAAVVARYPPLGRFVEAEGVRLHYLEAGQQRAGAGPPLVLLHGASGNLRDWWLSILPALGRRHRVIAFDRPGFGHSEPGPGRHWRLAEQTAVLYAGLHALGVRRCLLVGHSWSGALALHWALARPGEVAGLGLISGAAMDWGGALDLHYRLGATPAIGRMVAAALPRLLPRRRVEAVLRPIFAPQPVPPRYMREGGVELALRARTFVTNARAVRDLYSQILANQPHYPEIACPVELVHGTADRIVPAEVHAVPLTELLPRARLTRLDGIGHMPHHAEPDRVIACLDALARRCRV